MWFYIFIAFIVSSFFFYYNMSWREFFFSSYIFVIICPNVHLFSSIYSFQLFLNRIMPPSSCETVIMQTFAYLKMPHNYHRLSLFSFFLSSLVFVWPDYFKRFLSSKSFHLIDLLCYFCFIYWVFGLWSFCLGLFYDLCLC